MSNADVVSWGQSISLTWSSSASPCTGTGGWSGDQPTSGTLQFTVTQNVVFTLNCGAGTSTASASVRIEEIGTSSATTSSLAYSATGLTTLNYVILPIGGTHQVYDPVNGLIHSITSTASTSYPQSLVSIDPTSGQVVASVPLNSVPWALAVSADGRYVYVVFSSRGAAIQRFETAGLVPDLSIPLDSTEWVQGISVSPVSSTTIAVTGTVTVGQNPSQSELQVFDGTTPRPNSYMVPVPSQVALLTPVWTPDGTGIVAPGGGINVFSVESQGVALANVVPAGGSLDGRLNGNTFFDDAGNVISLDGPIALLGQMSDYGSALTNNRAENFAINKSFTLDFDQFENAYLTSYSTTQYYAIDSIQIPLSNGLSGPGGGNVILWGSDGIAWTEGGSLIIARGSFADQGGSPAPIQALPTVAGGALFSEQQTEVSYALYDAHANDVTADRCGNLYAGISGTARFFPNSVLTFDPTSGAVLASSYAASEPSVIAVSADCAAIYVGADSSNRIARFSLPGLTAETPIPLVQSPPPTSGYLTALPFAHSLAVSPESASTIAVAMNFHIGLCNGADYGLAIFDGATRRPDVFTAQSSGPKTVVWGKDASTLYEEDWDGIKALTADTTGPSQPTLLVPYADLEGDTDIYDLSRNLYFDPGKLRLLSSDGAVYDTVAATALPKLPVHPVINGNGCDLYGAVATDQQSGKIFYAQFGTSSTTIISFDSGTLQQIDQVIIPTPPGLGDIGGPIRLVHVSNSNSMAMVTESGYVLVLSGSMFGP